ncbi:MAG: hypothetical protein EOP84_10235 [Verrucomicrobiaceae bacterium]|nr:MAG: hypothetical protein EOP84_10235 [Verrucomicrobiaceae bacterium]
MFLRFLPAVFAFLLPVLTPLASAQVSPVSMRVEQVNSSDRDKHTTVQKRSLKVHLSNSSGQDQTGLRVKYYYFTKDVKDKDVIVKESGEKSADVKARATEIAETPVVKSSFTDDHFEGGGRNNNKGGRNNNFKAGKKVAASGDKIVGYGVQLYSGDKMIAEQFSGPSLKALVGGK